MELGAQIPDYKAFKRFIVLVVAALILFIIGFSVWKATVEYRLTVRAADSLSKGYARALKEHAERAFNEADIVLLDAVDHVQEQGGMDKQNSRSLRDFIVHHSRKPPQIGSIILVNKEGLLFAHSLDKPTAPANVADREYFIHHRDHPEDDTPFLSRPIKSRINGKWRFTLSRPIRSATGQFEGLVAVAFDMEYFQRFYSSLDLGKKGKIVILRKDAVMILAQPFKESDFAADFRQSYLFKTYLPKSPNGTYHIAGGKALIEPGGRIISYESLDSFPIVVNANMGMDEVTTGWRNSTYLQSLITLAACAGLYILMLVLLRQIRRIEIANKLQSEQQTEIKSAAVSWQSTFDSVADAIWVMDLDRNILRCNKNTEAIFGKEAKQVLGHICCEIAHNGKTPITGCPFARMLESGQREKMQLAMGERWFEVSVDPIRDSEGAISGAVHIVADITQLKRAEEKAIESEAEIRGLISSIPDAIIMKDPFGRWLLVNNAGIDIFSLHDVEYLGKTDLELAEMIPERREALLASQLADQFAWKLRDLTQTEETIPDSQGNAHIFDTSRIPLYKPDGSNHALVVVSRDITDQRQLEVQLRQAQKMEAIGHLAGGIAHDFNNLLTPIMGYAEMAAAKIPDGDPLTPKLSGIIMAANKAKILTQQLLNFGRRQSIATELIDLNDVILSFNSILRRTIKESIRINLVLDPEGAFIRGDRSQIEQIILNMTVNAQDAFDGTHGRINIETCKMYMDGENARMHPGMVPGEYLLLSFKDNGCGMSSEVMNHIFEPFYTTKQVGHGTGLGLATVYGIVRQHDAYISVTSHEGAGTTFNIFFPVSGEVPPPETVVEQQTHRLPVKEITILLVEDNEMVRDMVNEMLLDVGYTVLVASDPQNAFDLLSKGSPQVDLLVSDVVMPGMNGPELYEKLILQIPTLKVVFISGYPINPALRGGTLGDEVNYLQKPFTREALLERINQVL